MEECDGDLMCLYNTLKQRNEKLYSKN
jgi:hypothetical protein